MRNGLFVLLLLAATAATAQMTNDDCLGCHGDATATKDLSVLVSQEVALAKAELKKEVAHAGKGAGMFGGAGFLGLLAVIFLSISLAYAISWFGIGLGSLSSWVMTPKL